MKWDEVLLLVIGGWSTAIGTYIAIARMDGELTGSRWMWYSIALIVLGILLAFVTAWLNVRRTT